jgi:preprotein translocase subunit YajC
MINFSNILISDSFADTVANANDIAATAPQTGVMNFVPLILIFLVFYFLLVRPQQKKMKEHQNTLNHLKNGDKVQTSGGIFGVIKSIDSKENIVELEIASNVTIKVLKQSIADVTKEKAPAHKSKKNK